MVMVRPATSVTVTGKVSANEAEETHAEERTIEDVSKVLKKDDLFIDDYYVLEI